MPALSLPGTVIAIVPSAARAAGGTPQIGQAPQYVNPLNLLANSIDGGSRSISLSDPAAVSEGNPYYLFATCVTNGSVLHGGAWTSKDLASWEWKPLDPISAPLRIAPR